MIWIAIAGVITGILGAVLGVGGGMFLIPVLVFGLHIPMHNAVATSILAVIATSSAVASTNVERGTANMRLGMTLEIATTAGAIGGGLLAGMLSSNMLETVFAAVLIPTIFFMWRGRGEQDPDQHPANVADSRDMGALGGTYIDEPTGNRIVYRVRRLWAGMGISLFAGGLSGLLGTGGGAFHVPGLHLACGVPVKAAAATSNFMIGVTAAASAFLYYGRGQVIPGVTAAAVLGVLVGSAIGSFTNRSLHSQSVRKLFAVLLAILAAYMFYHVWSEGGYNVSH
ncbi:MAG: hypothetical protein JWN70_320 [Planctomycetaceae bacterium]|nr:hypothetical protein [Planctomycetaceae bacterium]